MDGCLVYFFLIALQAAQCLVASSICDKRHMADAAQHCTTSCRGKICSEKRWRLLLSRAPAEEKAIQKALVCYASLTMPPALFGHFTAPCVIDWTSLLSIGTSE